MSIMDFLCELSDNQDLEGTAATTQSTHNIDWGAQDLNIGAGEPVYLNIKVSEAFGGAGTVNFKLMSDSTTTVTSGTLIYETGTIAYTVLVLGYEVLRMPLPVAVDAEQITALVYVNSGTLSSGKIDAWLSLSTTSSLPITTQVRASNI